MGEKGEVPTFISNAPWYAKDDEPKATDINYDASANSSIKNWYARGRKAGPAATKYRKGACENCGAMTHKTKDCLERPRSKKSRAKWSGKDIAPDEVISNVEGLGFEAQRDRVSIHTYSLQHQRHVLFSALYGKFTLQLLLLHRRRALSNDLVERL